MFHVGNDLSSHQLCQMILSRELQPVFCLSPEETQEAATSQLAEGQLPDGQWMTQSFADQIPDISGGPKEGSV